MTSAVAEIAEVSTLGRIEGMVTDLSGIAMPDYKAYFSPSANFVLEFVDRQGNPIGAIKVKPSTLWWKAHGQKNIDQSPSNNSPTGFPRRSW